MNSFGSIGWVGVLGLACAAAPAKVDGAEERQEPAACRLGERRRQACVELGEAELKKTDGTSVKLDAEICDVTAYGGLVSWMTREPTPQKITAMVKFDRTQVGERLVPERLAPVQQAWPCPEGCERDVAGKVVIGLRRPCDARGRVERTVELALPQRGRTGCVGGSWYYGTDESWCGTELGAGRQAYWIRRWHGFGRFEELGPVVVDEKRVSVRHEGLWKHVEDAEVAGAVNAQLSALWSMSPRVYESCRDGAPTLVRALRSEEWRVVSRGCTDPAGILRLFRELATGTE